MILITHILAIAFGISLMEKQNDEKILFVLKLCIASTIVDGCVSSFFVSYWFFLENLADKFCIIIKRIQTLKLNSRQCQKYSEGTLLTQTKLLNNSNFRADHIRNLSKLHNILLNIVNNIKSCYSLQVCNIKI